MRLRFFLSFWLLAFCCFLALVADPALAGPADEINAAIADQGLSWVAADNEVARLHRDLGWYTPGVMESIDLSREFEPFVARTQKAGLPAVFDWRNVDGGNYVTKPKNQLNCGGCWAFATTGPIETAIAFAEGWLDPHVDLSEQQLISCSSAGSCATGGLTTASFRFAENTGLTREECFPYKGRDSEPCDDICDDWRKMAFKIDSWRLVSVAGFSIDDVKAAILEAPVAASMIIYEDFFYYESGVYENTKWIPQGLHAVTLIGWEDAQSCWIAKNSWGTGWGDGGFFKIRWGNSLIGSMSILPTYTSQGLGPEPDDDDDADDDGADDDDDADDDGGGDPDDDTEGEGGDDDDDSGDDDGGCCG